MIEIRPLNKDDRLDDLISLSREFFAEYESHHAKFFEIDRLRDSDITSYFSRWTNSDEGETFVALVGDRMVGSITVYVQAQPDFWKVKKVGVISGLMVHKAHRRRGIAEQLLARAKAFFEAQAVTYFTVYTAVANQGAIEFYRKCGLVPLYTTLMGQVNKAPEDPRA